MPGATESAKLAAQAEEKLRPLVEGKLSAAGKAALDRRMETALTLLPLLQPIADKHGIPVSQLLAIHVVETRGGENPMSRTSSAGATGPFQLTSAARKDYAPSAKYDTTVEADADSAAQYIKAAKNAGFTMPEAIGMTYIGGISGVKNWGGGAENNIGENSLVYGPMFKYAIEQVDAQMPGYLKSLERPARAAGVEAMQAVLRETPELKMETGLRGLFVGPSEEEFEAARKTRMDAAEQARKMAYETALPDTKLAARQAAFDKGYR
jgi:hypothetical protein